MAPSFSTSELAVGEDVARRSFCSWEEAEGKRLEPGTVRDTGHHMPADHTLARKHIAVYQTPNYYHLIVSAVSDPREQVCVMSD